MTAQFSIGLTRSHQFLTDSILREWCQVFVLELESSDIYALFQDCIPHSLHLATSPRKRSPLAVRNCSQLPRSHQYGHMSVSISTPYHLPFDWPSAIISTPPVAAGAETVPCSHPIPYIYRLYVFVLYLTDLQIQRTTVETKKNKQQFLYIDTTKRSQILKRLIK